MRKATVCASAVAVSAIGTTLSHDVWTSSICRAVTVIASLLRLVLYRDCRKRRFLAAIKRR